MKEQFKIVVFVVMVIKVVIVFSSKMRLFPPGITIPLFLRVL